MNKQLAMGLGLIMGIVGALLGVAPVHAAAGTGGTCATDHEEYRYEKVVPGVAAVTHQEYRTRARTPLYGSEEIKSIRGWNFVDGGTTYVRGQAVAGQWVKADSGTWYVIPAVIINIVWGPSGVPAAYLGQGTISLAAYGGPNVIVAYNATKVTTTAGYTAWGPWSAWSTHDPGAATATTDVDSRVVVDSAATPDTTVYYLTGGATSTDLTAANWTTDRPAAPWTLIDRRSVHDSTACGPPQTAPPKDDVLPASLHAHLTCAPSRHAVTFRVRRDGTLHATSLRDAIRVSGLPRGATVSGSATLYGPTAHRQVRAAAPRVGTVRFTSGNGTVRTRALQVTRPGYYAWVVSSNGNAKRCSPVTAHRPRPDVDRIPTGFAGQVRLDARRAALTAVSLPAVGIHDSLQTVGSNGGSMTVPEGARAAGWLRSSAAIDELIGTTVIAGHVSDRTDRPGAFWKLRNARPGQIVSVTAGGRTLRFKVVSRTAYDRTRLPASLFRTTGAHRLELVTCAGRVSEPGGRFHYRQNLVVVAVPVR